MQEWRLKSVRQCEYCPFRKSTNPFDIPDGYSLEKHEALRNTITDDVSIMQQLEDLQNNEPLKIMSCHKYQDAHCIGWLCNQIERGNNIQLRIHLTTCENAHLIELNGEQHQTFEDTIPKEKKEDG